MTAAGHLERRVAREIESRKEAEQLLDTKSLELYLKNQELRLSTGKLLEQVELIGVIMDAVPDVVITCNDRYRIETVNSACANVLGYSQAEFVGTLLTDFMPALPEFHRTLARDAFMISDITARKRDGVLIDAELRGRWTKLYGKPLIVIILHDISSRKASEVMKQEIYRQLHELRRLEAIGTLASGIAHELNTPIQFIGDNVKFIGLSLDKIHASYLRYEELRAECSAAGVVGAKVAEIDAFNRDINLNFLTAEIAAAMRETMEGIKQVRDIVLLMKEFAHPGTGNPEPCDIKRVIEGALTICRSRTKNVVSVETDLMHERLRDPVPPRSDPAGSRQSDRQCGRGDRGAGHPGWPHPGLHQAVRPLRPDRDQRQRARRAAGAAREDLRSVFHHEADWQGHGAGFGARQGNHRPTA